MPALPLQFSDSEQSDMEEEEQWSRIDNPPNIEPFLSHPGVRVTPTVSNSVMDVVQLFIGNDLFEFMVEESNRYHAQNESRFRQTNKSIKWKPINIINMKKMLGLILLMGQVQKPTRRDFWSSDQCIETPIFSKTMSRDRFHQIWRSWHFSNNQNITEPATALKKFDRL